MPKKTKIYLDHSATTPIDPQALKAMMPYLQEKYGNASSIHSFGQDAMAGVNKARIELADFLNCQINEILFTSGATESNNLAILGFLNSLNKNSVHHIITSEIEHPAVLEACKHLEKEGAEISYIKINKEGFVCAEDVKKAIKKNTVLVSIMYVNNEIGTIQPIREIGKIIKKHNKSLPDQKIVFHTDATQAINYCNCNTKYLHVDMLSLSGHKIYGPKGVGALYISDKLNLAPLQYGGGQENSLKPGTYNTAGIAGLGKAIEIIKKNNIKENEKILKLRDRIIKKITKKIPNITINGSLENRTPSNINLSFKGIEGEALVIMLDMEGIAVSTGSACSSVSEEPSYVLKALGLSPRLAEGSIRITLGKYNTASEIDYFIDKLTEIVEKLRKVSNS